MSHQVGHILEGRYEIKRVLQSGGMGALYEAHDTRLDNSPCAVKEMLSNNPDSREYIQKRFKEEMKVLARLNHPGIPRIRDYFSLDNTNYIVMDLIEGENLLGVLRHHHERTGKPMEGHQVIDIALQILDILEYLHTFSPPLIHRDIKPANIIQEPNGSVRLVDFGLACHVSDETRTQVGTMGYCPLEQMQGKAVPQSDLFSLGATMHHLLTAQTPLPLSFAPLGRVRPDLPILLSDAVSTVLAREPRDRFPNAAEFRKALVRIKNSQTATMPRPHDDEATGIVTASQLHGISIPAEVSPIYAQPVSAVSNPPWLWPALAVSTVGMLVLVWMVIKPSPAPTPTAEATPVVATPSPGSRTAPPANSQPLVQDGGTRQDLRTQSQTRSNPLGNRSELPRSSPSPARSVSSSSKPDRKVAAQAPRLDQSPDYPSSSAGYPTSSSPGRTRVNPQRDEAPVQPTSAQTIEATPTNMSQPQPQPQAQHPPMSQHQPQDWRQQRDGGRSGHVPGPGEPGYQAPPGFPQAPPVPPGAPPHRPPGPGPTGHPLNY